MLCVYVTGAPLVFLCRSTFSWAAVYPAPDYLSTTVEPLSSKAATLREFLGDTTEAFATCNAATGSQPLSIYEARNDQTNTRVS
jgi:hypothetical protein